MQSELHNSICGGGGPAMPPTGSDMALVAAAQRGNSEAVEMLLRRYEARVFQLAQNITGNREDAEEAVQDAFVRAFSRLQAFRGDSLFSTWLTRIAINEALTKLRKRRRANTVSLEDDSESRDGKLPQEIVDWGMNPEQRYAQTELREILQKSLAALSDKERIVFQLRDVEELTIDETAEILKLSKPAVKSRLLRARLALREKLNSYFRLPVSQERVFAEVVGD